MSFPWSLLPIRERFGLSYNWKYKFLLNSTAYRIIIQEFEEFLEIEDCKVEESDSLKSLFIGM